MRQKTRWTRWPLLLAALITIAAGCTQAQDPADRYDYGRPDRQRLPKMTMFNHQKIMGDLLGKPAIEAERIGILVYDGVNDLDFTGPRYVLGQSGAKTRLIGVKPGPIKTVMGVQVVPDTTIDEVKQLDILVIPGGFTGTIEAAYDPKVLDWIRAIDKTSTYTASVCTGGWILGNRIDGTQAEFVRIPHADMSLYPVPAGVDDEALVMLSDILPTGLECGVQNGRVQPGSTVAVVGAGPIGLAALLTAQFHAPAKLILVDLDDGRLEMARRFGATDTVNSGDEDRTTGW